jgi:TolA-binding protein
VPARAVAIELERLVTDAIAGPEALEAVREHLAATGAAPDAERLALARVLLAADERETALGLLEGVAGAGSAIADLGREARFRGDRVGASELLALALTMDLEEHERADVALTLAMLQRDGGAWRQALQTLDATPALAGHPEALLMRARLLTDRARELEAAREAWDKLAACAEARYREAAREGMADWLFASGRLDEAEAAYAELAEERPTDEVGFEPLWGELPPLPPGMLPPGIGIAAPPVEEAAAADPARAALRLAEIALRRGDLEAAEARFRFVVDEHPLGVYANDALERLAFMRENLDGEGGSEARYLEAIGLMERGEAAMARDLLLEIAGTRDEPLADDALMALGEVRLMQGDARAAVETWLSLPERFAESMLAPGALLRAAEVLRGELADEAGAADALRRITEGYPDSAAADQARSELELLGRRDP